MKMNRFQSGLAGVVLLTALMLFARPTAAVEDSGEENKSLTLGGAIRWNAAWKDYDQDSKDRSGEFGFEVFMATVDAEYGDFHAAVQYRWY